MRILLSMALLVLCGPLAALETLIISKSAWWNTPYRQLTVAAAAVWIVFGILVPFVISGRYWAYYAVRSLGVLWCVSTLVSAVVLRNFWLGLFGIGLSFCWVLLSFALWREIDRSFMNPRKKWYQGIPEPIPGLRCGVVINGKEHDANVNRLDQDGIFVFTDLKGVPTSRGELLLSYGSRRVPCTVRRMRFFKQESGIGYKFCDMSMDQAKDLADFVEHLRGLGHVE